MIIMWDGGGGSRVKAGCLLRFVMDRSSVDVLVLWIFSFLWIGCLLRFVTDRGSDDVLVL